MTLEEQLSETVRLLMTRTGARQEDVAAALQVTRGSLSQKLLTNSRWRVNELVPLAEHFGLTVCELVSGYSSIPTDRLPPSAQTAGQTRI